MQKFQAPIAVIDMGTNTFHLLVAGWENGHLRTILEQKQGVRLGKDGISKAELAPEAIQRAIECLTIFLSQTKEHGIAPPLVHAFATSAVRSAKNGQEFVALIQNQLGLQVQILDGVQEAEYIFEGVQASGALEIETGEVLAMDIGGGSVEFILGDKAGQIKWLQSFELGGQRLVDTYMALDPIPDKEVKRLKSDLRAQLKPLKEACKRYKPSVLVGASGTFDTLRELEYPTEPKPYIQNWKDLSLAETLAISKLLRGMNRQERLAHAAISDLRADMIVVALILLEEALRASGAMKLRQCNWALKEGAAYQLLHRQDQP
jgi:exopolyphosphatase/guanosine-5'-triphosphate,3'-diphosphate pyrophosphatase